MKPQGIQGCRMTHLGRLGSCLWGWMKVRKVNQKHRAKYMKSLKNQNNRDTKIQLSDESISTTCKSSEWSKNQVPKMALYEVYHGHDPTTVPPNGPKMAQVQQQWPRLNHSLRWSPIGIGQMRTGPLRQGPENPVGLLVFSRVASMVNMKLWGILFWGKNKK